MKSTATTDDPAYSGSYIPKVCYLVRCSLGSPDTKMKVVKIAGAYGATKKGRLSPEKATIVVRNFGIGPMRTTRARHKETPDMMYDLLEDEGWDVS